MNPRASARLAFVLLLALALCAQAIPIHVTHLWHMHQPIYFPYETLRETDSNGRFPYNIEGSVFDGDRRDAYQYWPPSAVGYAHSRGMAHGGSQVSYSGSLGENASLLGFDTGPYKAACNDKKTSLGNPRLDMVGIAYHHSLMPLTCKESMQMQIRLHKEQYKDRWGTTEYSKGFWPPECAFDQTMIPALVDEGLEWVIVDNGHLFRTVSDFPWSSASSCKPNAADLVNGSAESLNSEWVQLPNVWAPTKVLAPWSYQPHHVQHVNPETGEIKKIVAVPAGRYEGNENGRGGYGAFKPENVWGGNVSANSNANKPMLLLLHSDGDNFGMKNSDAWNGQQELFLNMVQSNPDFEYTSVQDYLDLYPPAASDVIHVEPGSWIGIDGGTPYYEKWLSSDYQGDTNPDRWSWSVLVAAQNRVILADTLENTYSMNDVEWGIGSDTAKAWHFYLNAETSCYWYWDHSGEPWDGHVTRASNMAIAEAMKVINRHPGGDNKGPSIFPPQRNYYNPGSYMWKADDPDPSDFTVWSYVDDVSGLQSVVLKWRTDKDGHNPLASTQNETYAGGNEVNAWNSVPMTGSWDPASKVSVCPDAVARAQMFKADITGQNNVLIDYYIEATDSLGNVAKSEIIHVAVGDVGPAPEPELTITGVSSYPGPNHVENQTLNPAEDLWIDAYTSGGTPTAIEVHHAVNGGAWTATAMTTNGAGAWHLNLGTFNAGQCVDYYVTARNAEVSTTNNNNGANYTICSVQPVVPLPNGVVITNPAAATVTVANAVTEYSIQGTAGTNLTGNLMWTNALTGGNGQIARTAHWDLPASLAVGDNVFTLSAQIAGSGSAATTIVAVDSVSAYANWTNGSNEGSGFGNWTLSAVDGNSGHFTSLNGWGMWSHESNNLAEAIRPFSAPLSTGQTFEVHMKNGWIWEQGGSIGVALQSSEGDTIWQCYFNGGDTNYNVSTGVTDINWTDAGLDITYTITGPSDYRVTIQPVGGIAREYTGTVGGQIARLRAWSYSNGTADGQNSSRDFFFDKLKITTPAAGEVETHSDSVTITRQSGDTPPPFPIEMNPGFVGNGLGFRLATTKAGAQYAVWASPILFPTQNWQMIVGTETQATGGPIDLSITNGLLPTNFYRIGYTISP